MASPTNVARFSIFLQDACLRHRFIRSKDISNIVERSERLRAVNVGISAALARLGPINYPPHLIKQEGSTKQEETTSISGQDPLAPADDLIAALEKLNISNKPSELFHRIVRSSSAVDLLNNPAVKFVHGDIEGDVYLENIIKWAKESRDNIAKGGSEIPPPLSQGDLYLCPGSIDAIQGALGTVCEAVDSVVSASRQDTSSSQPLRAFVSIRPPGHHCGEDTPSGFCFVNNVAVAAAHAHLKHSVNRVVIFDIDLHHGNGTQSIVWQINEETYRNTLEASYGSTSAKPGPQIYYGSIHDILSYPCEDGKMALVQAASTSIHGPHGQYVENIHLQTYTSDEEFWEEHYAKRYSKLFSKAEEFLDQTGGQGGDVLVFISCGFDACEHEHQSMQRHQRRVPTSFYHRFTRDACAFADKYAKGRLVSVLEGGYSDRALTSGAMAHVAGLSGKPNVNEEWWSINNLIQLEQATKKHRSGRISQTLPPAPHPDWIQRTLEIFSTIDTTPPVAKPVVQASSMSLRERSKPSVTPEPRALGQKEMKRIPRTKSKTERLVPALPVASESVVGVAGSSALSDNSSQSDKEKTGDEQAAQKKLPRVILRLGSRDTPTAPEQAPGS